MSPPRGTRGYLTLALGPPRYARMARWLVLSLQRACPGVPVAVVTDSDDRRLARLAAKTVPPRPGIASPYEHKLWLDTYSPFDQTVFLDADCIAVRDPGDVWERYGAHHVGVLGANQSEGPWFLDIAAMCRLVGSETVPRLSGGLIRFDSTAVSREVFAAARTWWSRYDEIGVTGFRGDRPDEPALALALAERGIRAYDDTADLTYRTTASAVAPTELDVLRGRATVRAAWGTAEPAIVHFADSADDPAYLRAGRSLTLAALGLPRPAAALLAASRSGRLTPSSS